MHVFYLHGFASSSNSSKAAFFRARLGECGVPMDAPDFNEPDFSTLTISRMVAQVEQAIDAVPDQEIVLLGSSLGAFVAIHAALRRPRRVSRMVLLAPALDLGGNRLRTLGDRGIEEWKRTDRLEVFHHAFGRVLPVHFEFYTDATRYDSLGATLDLPVQVFQGLRDVAVDPPTTKRWADERPNVQLHELDDDHQLYASLEYIWTETAAFLGLNRR